MSISSAGAISSHFTGKLCRCMITVFLAFAVGHCYALPPGFEDELVLDGLTEPTHLTQLPDGRMLVLEKQGKVLMFDPENPSDTPAIYLTIHDINIGGERGLMSLVLDPEFEDNRYIYLYYSNDSTKKNRISRFNDHGDFADPASELLLWQDNEKWKKCCHHGGGLGFGPDGKLYLTIGEGFQKRKSPDLQRAGGKIIRINKDGSIPLDNPFVDGDGGNLDEIWAFGLRNPFRSYWDKVTGRMFFGDVGGNEPDTAREEINIAERGANYGWPACEGKCGRKNVKDPLYDYEHDGPKFHGGSVTAGFVYWGNAFPAEYSGVFFFGDYSLSWIRYLRFDIHGNLEAVENFATDVGAPVFLMEGQDGALYYVDYSGSIHRIVYTDHVPASAVAEIGASYVSGKAPLTVRYIPNVEGADADSLEYTWWFGDGTVSTEREPEHTYTNDGPYEVYVRVSDGVRAQLSSPFLLQVGVPPTVKIAQPASCLLFRAGDEILFSGSARDSTGQLPPRDLHWSVEPIGEGMSKTLNFVGNTGGFAVGQSEVTAYKVKLTAVDANNLEASESITLFADQSPVEVDVVPRVVPVYVNGVRQKAPALDKHLIGSSLNISVPETYCYDGTQYQFVSWSNGAEPSNNVIVPELGETYIAQFEKGGICNSPPLDGLVLHLEADSGVSKAGGRVLSWSDQSGLGNELKAHGGPRFLPGVLNGHPVIDLDGKHDMLDRVGDLHGFPDRNHDRTLIVLAKYRGRGWGGFTYGTGEIDPQTCNRAFGPVVDRAGNLAVHGWCDDFSSWEAGVDRGWLMQTAVLESGEVSHYLGELLVDMVDHTYDTSLTRLVIGAELDGRPYVDMQIAAALAYDRALTENEVKQVADYVKEKYLMADGSAAEKLAIERKALVKRGSETKIAVFDAEGEKIRHRLAKPNIRLLSKPEHGTLEYNSTKSLFEYRHDGSKSLKDGFTYTVDDEEQCSPVMTIKVGIDIFGSSFFDVQNIFNKHCVICHDGGHPPNLSEGFAYPSIVGVSSNELASLDYVMPEEPEASYLWHKISGTHSAVGGSGQRMPLTGGYLSRDELSTVRRWIERGAQPPGGASKESSPWYQFW